MQPMCWTHLFSEGRYCISTDALAAWWAASIVVCNVEPEAGTQPVVMGVTARLTMSLGFTNNDDE